MSSDEAASPTPLLEPSGGVPDVITEPAELDAAISVIAAGSGPIAVDTERASGYRYGQRAYLIQLAREGSGTFLIDPIPFGDLTHLGTAIAGEEWILHAASQDLPCLAEIGMRPRTLFDTELAGRIAGFPRVGLGSMVEHFLGISLEKAHSAADWSRRPLPADWLRYAALDVELLVELRDALDNELRDQGKRDWAAQEFAALVDSDPFAVRAGEPWRRTSGMHQVRGRRQLAAVRSLWLARDELARELDLAPGRVFPDMAIVAAAMKQPTDAQALARLAGAGNRTARAHSARWLAALAEADAIPEVDLPHLRVETEGPPPAHRWSDRDPVAAGRLERARAAVVATAAELKLPAENLISPDAVRRLAWQPPEVIDAETVAQALSSSGAREWQVSLMAGRLADALNAPPTVKGAAADTPEIDATAVVPADLAKALEAEPASD
ncbi:MAG: ribonuclease [Frankiales bacterium]|nr:ribonuclease [Frankiales bacterium]